MSDTGRKWDTKAVRAFVEAFAGHIQEPTFLERTVGVTTNARVLLDTACEMLQKRRQQGEQSFAALDAVRPCAEWSVTEDQRKVCQNLAQATDAVLLSRDPKKTPKLKDVDAAVNRAISMEADWKQFEDKCIQLRNQMAFCTSEAELRVALTARAGQLQALAGLASDAVKASAVKGPDFSSLIATLKEQQASPQSLSVTDTLMFLEGANAKLIAEIPAIAQGIQNANEKAALYTAAFKKLYDIDVNQTATAGTPIAFEPLLKAFAMVPIDHTLLPSLKNLTFKPMDGGEYNAQTKGINIDSRLQLTKVETYRDPETGKDVRVSSFSITTLHEIGHAVDEAHGIMKRHAGKEGCGGWKSKKMLPLINKFVDTFCSDMAQYCTEYRLPAVRESLVRLHAEGFMGGNTPAADVAMLICGDAALAVIAQPIRDAMEKWIVSALEPISLAKYRADQRPWDRDISQEQIAGEEAYQEPQPRATEWLRYSEKARKDTFVSNYQWRAPAEWFAELYAVSWFKKVEPPATVADEVREFMYGGHLGVAR